MTTGWTAPSSTSGNRSRQASYSCAATTLSTSPAWSTSGGSERTPRSAGSAGSSRRLRSAPLYRPGLLHGGIAIPAERQRPAKDSTTLGTSALLGAVTHRSSVLHIHRRASFRHVTGRSSRRLLLALRYSRPRDPLFQPAHPSPC